MGISVWNQLINNIKEANTFKEERIITSPMGSNLTVANKSTSVLNFCANNYLGMSNHPDLVKAAEKTLKSHGLGLSSVRFICGTQDIHKELERKISQFHGTEDTILYGSCFDANGGIFEALLEPEVDAIYSDSLNHASIIDGMRLSKSQKFKYNHLDMGHLEDLLKTTNARIKFIVTDGAFSMDGDIAPLDKICELAEKYKAIVMIDDCHATGFIGKTGRGTPEFFGLNEGNRVHIINSTLGKALGGATGGYTTGPKEAISLLRQKSRPYLFSNSIAPVVAGAGIAMFDILMASNDLKSKLDSNTNIFRTEMIKAGFKISGHPSHPIAPVMIGDAGVAQKFATKLLDKGIYVIAFSYPVVPKGLARIRVQLSAAHTNDDVRKAVKCFIEVGQELNVIS